MKYPKEYLDEIKAKLKVSTIVGKKVKLKRRGKEYVGLSPFSNEKTPSFTVNDDKGFFHCFSTSEHGNIFDFIMKTEGFRFGEAVKKLAAEAGMPIYRFTKLDEEVQKKWDVYKKICDFYSKYYNKELLRNKNSEQVEYLRKRKVGDKEINFFRLGYVNYENKCLNELKSNFSQQEIVDTGLYFFDKDKEKILERFKGRIIFPIQNINGSIIGFGGRIIKNEKFAKYINSPETYFFKKGNNLYNINNVRQISSKINNILIVEGYMDVISLNKYGINNVVANLGTALTEKQLDLAWRCSKNVIICFDGDVSGKNAALRSAERLFSLLKPDLNLFFLFLPKDQDPDSYIQSIGKDDFNRFLESKTPVYEFLWNYYYSIIDKSNPSSFAVFEKKIRNLCSQFKDKSLSKYFLEYYLDKLEKLTPRISKRRQKYKSDILAKPLTETKKASQKFSKYSEKDLKEYSLLFIILNFIDIFSDKKELLEINFSNSNLNNFYHKLKESLHSDKFDKNYDLINDLKNGPNRALILEINDIAPVKTIIKNKDDEAILELFSEIQNQLQSYKLKTKIENLEKKLLVDLDQGTYNELIRLKNEV